MLARNYIVCCTLCFLVLSPAFGRNLKSSPGWPMVLVPGDGGSQLQAKLDKPGVVHYLCQKHTNTYFELWLNLELLLYYVIDCLVDNMRLVYNNVTHTTSNSPGVSIRTVDWGNTSGVEWLDSSENPVGHYFATIVQNAVAWGYRRGKDVRGAPFDFRKAPNEASDFFVKFKKLVEDTYYVNGNRKVVLVGHSMGNSYLLYFLNRQTQDWKDKFIRSYVSIAGPWGGSMKTLKVMASGYNFDHWSLTLPPLKMRAMQRTMPSTTFLFPTDKFWNATETLVFTPEKNYTMQDFQQFFEDIKYETGWQMYQDNGFLLYNLTAPGVEVHCLYGTGLQTANGYIYGKGAFPDTQPTEVEGDGDGTVNLQSALGCLRWKNEQKQAIYSKAFPGQEHVKILKNPDIVAYIKKVVYDGVKPTWKLWHGIY